MGRTVYLSVGITGGALLADLHSLAFVGLKTFQCDTIVPADYLRRNGTSVWIDLMACFQRFETGGRATTPRGGEDFVIVSSYSRAR